VLRTGTLSALKAYHRGGGGGSVEGEEGKGEGERDTNLL